MTSQTGKINTVFAQVGLTLDGVERNHDQIVDAIWATLQQSGEVKSQTQPPTSSDQGFTEPKPKSKDRRIDYKALTAIAEDGFLLVGMGWRGRSRPGPTDGALARRSVPETRRVDHFCNANEAGDEN
jgi:hypothetical protein